MTSSTSRKDQMQFIVERLFDSMLLLFGKRFSDMWSGIDPQKMKNAWAAELQEYTLNELKQALEAVKQLDWPPTLPEFKKLCRRPLNALEAYYEAVKGMEARSRGESFEWTHPLIFWAASPITYELMAHNYAFVRARWEREFDQQMRAGHWRPIPDVCVSVEYKRDEKRSAELAKKAIDLVKQFLNKNKVP